MLAFATYITDEQVFVENGLNWQIALQGPDAITAQCSDEPTVAHGYNTILEAFASDEAIEAVVLSRQELTVDDPDIINKIRSALSDPLVAIVGISGAKSIVNLAWRRSDAADPQGSESVEVDVVDNSLVVLSRWAMDSLRFDEKISTSFDGIVEDLCMQARSFDRKSVVVSISSSDIQSSAVISSIENYRWAHDAFANKWSAQLTSPEPGYLHPLLEIGGGTNALKGWLNIDTEHAEGEFLRGAQETPWPIPDNYIRMIWASHVMEHIPAGSDRIAVMNEAWRVLQPGGLFEIRLPCFPHWSAIADPTHVSFWVPESFLYFTGQLGANADYGFKLWEPVSLDVHDGWELRGVLRKPTA